VVNFHISGTKWASLGTRDTVGQFQDDLGHSRMIGKPIKVRLVRLHILVYPGPLAHLADSCVSTTYIVHTAALPVMCYLSCPLSMYSTHRDSKIHSAHCSTKYCSVLSSCFSSNLVKLALFLETNDWFAVTGYCRSFYMAVCGDHWRCVCVCMYVSFCLSSCVYRVHVIGSGWGREGSEVEGR